MTNNFTEVDILIQQSLEEVEFTAPGKLVLAEIERSLAARDIAEIFHWERAHYKAAMNWLKKYKPKPDATNLEKVRGYLEAFHHLCEVEDWEKASEILLIHLDTPTNEGLHAQLGTWGYYREQSEVYTRILGKLSPILNAVFLNGLGNLYQALAKYDKAIEFHQQHLAIWQEFQERQGEGIALGNLGSAYLFLSEYAKAIEFLEQSLAIARELQDRHQEGTALVNLAIFYHHQGDYARAIEFSQQGLAIAREFQDRRLEGAAIGNLGLAYRAQKDYAKAREYHDETLKIIKEIQYLWGE